MNPPNAPPYNLFFIRPLVRSEAFRDRVMGHALLSCSPWVGRLKPIISPVLSIEYNPLSLDFRRGWGAFLVTSVFGADALGRWGGDPHTPVLAVGPETADRLTDLDFLKVLKGEGDDRGLVSLALKTLPSGTSICHLSGRHIARDLYSDFKAAGFVYTRCVGYTAHAREGLSHDAGRALRAQTPGGVFLFSNRSRQIFESLALSHLPDLGVSFLDAYCYSKSIADGCTSPLWRSVSAVSSPPVRGGESMIELFLTNQPNWGTTP